MSIDKLIEKQNTEFYELGSKHGYDQGYHDGIMEAVKILRSATLAGDVEAAQDPYPAGEATFEIPGNDEATFDEKEAYYASLPVFGSDDEEPGIVEDVFARKSPVKHDKHYDFWKENEEAFKARLIDGSMSVSEAVEAAKPHGITYKGVKAKASRFGYGIKKNKFYNRVK